MNVNSSGAPLRKGSSLAQHKTINPFVLLQSLFNKLQWDEHILVFNHVSRTTTPHLPCCCMNGCNPTVCFDSDINPVQTGR